MRPLRNLENRAIELTVVPCAKDGSITPESIARALRPSTRAVVVTHASNVLGTILPIAEVAAIAHKSRTLLRVDAAQTADIVPLDIRTMGIDFLVFTGHKGLQGPQGTGGLIIGNSVHAKDMEPLWRGGTGSRSEFEIQPEDLHDSPTLTTGAI